MCHQTNMKFHQRAEAACERSIVVEKWRSQTDLMDFSTERENLMALWRDSALQLVGKSVEEINSFSYKFPICLRRAFAWGFFTSASPKCNENALFVSRRDEKFGGIKFIILTTTSDDEIHIFKFIQITRLRRAFLLGFLISFDFFVSRYFVDEHIDLAFNNSPQFFSDFSSMPYGVHIEFWRHC